MKWYVLLSLLLIGCSGGANPQAEDPTIEAIRRLHARLDVGMNLNEYRSEVADINVILSENRTEDGETALKPHLLALDLWSCALIASPAEQVGCHEEVINEIEATYPESEFLERYQSLSAEIGDQGLLTEGSREVVRKNYRQDLWQASANFVAE